MLSRVPHGIALPSWDSLPGCQDPVSGKVDRRTLLRGCRLSGVDLYGASRMNSKALLERPGRGLSGQRCVPGPNLPACSGSYWWSSTANICTRLKMQPLWLLAVALSGALNLNALSGSWVQRESGVADALLL